MQCEHKNLVGKPSEKKGNLKTRKLSDRYKNLSLGEHFVRGHVD
jgi:hypothetical protein